MDEIPLSSALAAGVLSLIGVAHSVLGEREVLRPLFADRRWTIGLARRPTEILLRWAWHLTTLAWFGLAAATLGAPPATILGVVCITSGVLGLGALRGHLAWPLFLLAGFAALARDGWLPSWSAIAIAALAALVSVGAAGLHLYWAFGGRRGLRAAVPERPDGRPAFEPGPLACLAVTVALLAFAGLLGWATLATSPWWVEAALGVATALLALRAIGDGRQVGFSKSNRRTRFARADDALYTPLVVLLAFGSLGALCL